ncbi:MAG: glycoside hydrolase family 30 protein [Flavobacteriales bacterium]|nr:glycoside hydrolase family 30 protein [Flavobacteriales bacterium]
MSGNRDAGLVAIILFLSILAGFGCVRAPHGAETGYRIYQTSASGDKLKLITSTSRASDLKEVLRIILDTTEVYQQITGFGGAFTESSAHLLFALDPQLRKEIIEAYFGDDGARYSLTRTHMNSCDFSLRSYSYVPLEGDTQLNSFSLDEDRGDIIPMIKMAQGVSKRGFKVIASPWTAPPWMKDNQAWFGGKLLKEYYPSWARFFTRYALEMKQEGIDIWAFTVENEPLGNDSHWESMHYTPEETADFVVRYLAPELKQAGVSSKILVYDQNRDEELIKWSEILLKDSAVRSAIYGTAVHWYSNTTNWMPENLDHVKSLGPEKHILHTEGCVDAEVPKWKDDAWYWKKEATDWGWDWAPEHLKKDHPKYVPVYRYARDIIGCLNSHVEGWVDWNMILDRQGGPNHAKNWCTAPVIVDTASNEAYFTPLYYIMAHFSKFIEPGAQRVGIEQSSDRLMSTAVRNPGGEIVVVVLNMSEKPEQIEIEINGKIVASRMDAQSIQTIVLNDQFK